MSVVNSPELLHYLWTGDLSRIEAKYALTAPQAEVMAMERVREWDYASDPHGYCHERPVLVALLERIQFLEEVIRVAKKPRPRKKFHLLIVNDEGFHLPSGSREENPIEVQICPKCLALVVDLTEHDTQMHDRRYHE